VRADDAESQPSQWFPSIQIITTLSLLSLVAGFSALSYLFLVRNAVRNLVIGSLFGGPIGMVGCGIVAFVGSMGRDGVEGDKGWRTGVRLFSVLCLVAAIIFARIAMNRRKRVARTIKVLEVSLSILPRRFLLTTRWYSSQAQSSCHILR
jgi:hypothetical protein